MIEFMGGPKDGEWLVADPAPPEVHVVKHTANMASIAQLGVPVVGRPVVGLYRLTNDDRWGTIYQWEGEP